MTVSEFLQWDSGDRSGALWQLRDGEPEMMAPASDRHGRIQGELTSLIGHHLKNNRPECSVVTAPGVVPRIRSSENFRIPDIGITCSPSTGQTPIPEPIALIEILSPSNEQETRTNIWTYTTIPSVQEIIVLHSTAIAAEILRRGPDGTWPEKPDLLGPATNSASSPSALPHRCGRHTVPRAYNNLRKRCAGLSCSLRH